MDEDFEQLPRRVLLAGALCTLAAVGVLFAAFVWLNTEPAAAPPPLVYKVF